MKIRKLRADEISVRVDTIKENGLSLLLYKDARCDMNILDETFSIFGWKREHTRDNQNCIVSIWDDTKKQWVSKEDAGKEGDYAKEKGVASDSFKRACTNFGIGRELYTSPFIWIPSSKCRIIKNTKDKYTCLDKFNVKKISYSVNGDILELEIFNKDKSVFYFRKTEGKKNINTKKETLTKDQEDFLTNLIREVGGKVEDFCKKRKIKTLSELEQDQFIHWSNKLNELKLEK